MKNIFSLLLICFVAVNSFSQTTEVAEFKFETEIIDYGKIVQKSEKTRVFKFTNVGTAPLIINRIQSSCGCTVPKKPEKPILPGETGEIEVSYDTNRLGGFSKSITIFSNAKKKIKTIKIKGFVSKEEV